MFWRMGAHFEMHDTVSLTIRNAVLLFIYLFIVHQVAHEILEFLSTAPLLSHCITTFKDLFSVVLYIYSNRLHNFSLSLFFSFSLSLIDVVACSYPQPSIPFPQSFPHPWQRDTHGWTRYTWWHQRNDEPLPPAVDVPTFFCTVTWGLRPVQHAALHPRSYVLFS